MKLKVILAPWKKSYDKPRQHIKKQRHHFANKGMYSQSYASSNSHVQMWELDHKEDWMPKNWCFQIVVLEKTFFFFLEKTLDSPLDSKEIKSVNPKGNQPWRFIERTDAEVQIFWPPVAKNQLIGKDPDAGKDWGQEKGMTEDEMVGWHHHWFNGYELWWTLGDGEGQGGLGCCSPWGSKETDTT